MAEFDKYLRRRMWREDGLSYFCRICGQYKSEKEFYQSKTGPFRIDTKCKIHYQKNKNEENDGMEYLKLNPLKETDFIDTQKLLETLGYHFGPESPPVHLQFNKKHNL